MWDEYDEGTQFLPAINKTADLPHDEGRKFTLIACDIDGYDVPPDWYMRIAGYGASLVKGERNNEDRFPENVLREWEPKYEVRPTLQSLLVSGSGASGTTTTQRPSYRNVPRRVAAADREIEEPPPPPYEREAGGNATVVSPGPEPPISTRPDVPRGDSRPPPPPPVSARPSFQAGLSPIRHPSPGVAPAIPLASRPTANSPPHSPHSPGPPPVPPKRGPSPAAHHGKAPSSPHHLSADHPAPMGSAFPHHMPMPQILSGAQYHMDDSVGGSSSYASPAAQVPMPPPETPWYSQPNTQPGWANQYLNNPNEMAPIHAPPPPPGQHLGAYGYEGGYNDSFSFPIRPSANYGYSQTPPILEPQQLNPGPPPPVSPSRESLPPCIGATCHVNKC